MIEPELSAAISIQAHKGIYAVLLGSGASRSAGIPTGWEVVMDLTRRLAIASGGTGENWENWYRGKFNRDPNYSELIAAIAPTQAERMSLLKNYFEPTSGERDNGIKIPTDAHRSLARLVAAGYIKIILTTNFDRLIEQALEAEKINPVIISNVSQIAGMMPLAHIDCLVLKIHGDYLDTRIKNTPEELSSYEPELAALLDRIFSEYGLLVCGWSAEWDAALVDAITRSTRFRFSTYWMARGKISTISESLVKFRQAKLIPITSADSAFASIETKVMAIASGTQIHPVSQSIAVATMKKYLSEPRYRIEMNDFIIRELESLRSAVDLSRMPISSPVPDEVSFPKRVQQIETAATNLVAAVATGVYWGDDHHYGLWKRALEGLSRVRTPSGTSYQLWDKLRWYPVNLLAYGIGLSAISSKKFGAFKLLFVDTFAKREDQQRPIISVIGTSSCLLNDGAQWLHPRLKDEQKKTPGSDWLVKRLPAMLRNILGEDIDFESMYDEFDILASLISYDTGYHLNLERFSWRGFPYGSHDYLSRLKEELKLLGVKHPLLEAGLFQGKPERLDDGIACLSKTVAERGFF